MSVTHLEEFVQLMVKSSSARLAEAAAKAVDGPNWRETLHRLVARCCRPKDMLWRGDDTESFANALQLANTVVSDFSPVVSLYDVLKYEDPTAQPVQQDQFLHYFDLQLNNNTDEEINKPQLKPHPPHYVRNLITTPQVPFSSDLGIKLIKERPEIPPEIHERKLERLERYLHTTSSNSTDVEYEVIYNKNIDLESSHFYTFPTRHFHDKNKLTPKARHLLKKYCRPCSVRLVRMTLNRLNPRKETQTINSETQIQQKENIQLSNKGIYVENRVALIDNFNPSCKTRLLSNKAIPVTSHNERTTRQRNFLKTLAPRDENTMDKNVVDACVVLQPISVMKLKGKSNSKKKTMKISKSSRSNTRLYSRQLSPNSRRLSPRLHVDNKPLLM